MVPSNRVVDIALGGRAPGGPVAWCRTCNLIAVAIKPVSHHEAQIVLVEPSDPTTHTLMRVPLGSGVDSAPVQAGTQPTGGVSYMEWSPPGSPRVLLVLTHCGKVFGFRQLQKASSVVQSINDWQGKPIMSLSTGERLLAIRWVEPQSAWNWPPARAAAGQLLSVHSQFVTPKATAFPKGDVKLTDNVLHWVRPGLLSCVAVMGNGHIRIWSCTTSRQDFHWAERKTSIAGIGDNILIAADAVTGPQQTLRICTVKQGDANTVTVSEMRGDPTAESCGKTCTKLTVAKVATVNMAPSAMGASLLSVHFDPSKSGRSFLCLLDDKVGGALQIICYRQKAKTNFEAIATLRFPLSSSPQPSAARKGLSAFRISNDGCMLAMARGDTPGTVHAVRTSVMERVCETLSLSDSGQGQLGAVGMTFSPNGTCLAVSIASASEGEGVSPRLQIFTLTDFTHLPALTVTGDEKTKADAWKVSLAAHRSPAQQSRLSGERTMWCLLHGHHHWDVVRRLKELDAIKLPALPGTGVEMTGLQVALSLVDEAIHCQPHALRGTISAEWDFVKVAAIDSDPLLDAQVVYMDLRARIMFSVLENMFKSFYNHENFQSMMNRQSRPHLVLDESHREMLEMWIDWVADFGEFFISNLQKWVQRQHKWEANPSDAARQDIDSVPCIRLTADQSFIKQLLASVVFCLFSLPQSQMSSLKRDKLNKTMDVLKKIGIVLQKRTKQLTQADVDNVGGELPSAQEAVASFKGRYRLHYSRTSGQVTWKAVSNVIPAQLPPVEWPDSEMLSKARSLGLLYSMPEDAATKSPVASAHLKHIPPPVPRATVLPFVVDGHGGLAGSVNAARRKRWREERDVAMGIQNQSSANAKSRRGTYARDIVSAALMTSSSDATHECLEAHFPMVAPPAVPGTHETTLKGVMTSSFSTVCGMSGGRWKRLNKAEA